MRKIWNFAMILFLLCAVPLTTYASSVLIPVGQVVGLQLENGTVTVSDVLPNSPAQKAGLQPGDCILALNGQSISTAQELKDLLRTCRGDITLELRRGSKALAVTLTPETTAAGTHLGIYLKEGVTGIGTVTYYDPTTGTFASLGHGVNDPSGAATQMHQGFAYPARVQSVRTGKAGSPGQLVGTLESSAPRGRLTKNTPQGLFGETDQPFAGEALPVAAPQEVKAGGATILSTVSGSAPREYSVEILKIYAKDRPNGRNLLIRVTDPALLSATGGIVQGMSGSPILQNGRIVGAVTHVLVNDPTTGYGIFIENMLEAADAA